MWSQFFLQNAHFGIGLLAALVWFAVSWLYFDAYFRSRLSRDLVGASGFTLLALSFLIFAVRIETNLLLTPFFGNQIFNLTMIGTRIGGYLLIVIALAMKPIQARPSTQIKQPAAQAGFFGLGRVVLPFQLLLPGVIAGLYFRQATVGLERHLRPAALGFMFLVLFELFGMGVYLRMASSSGLYGLVAPFGPVWVIEHVFLVLCLIIVGRWVSVYLFKRLFSQLLLIFTGAVVVIFILTSVTFTGLLVRNVELQALAELSTNARVMDLAFSTTKAEILSDAQLVAQDSSIRLSLEEGKRTELGTALETILVTKKLTTLVVVDRNGRVVGRGENRERLGDVLAQDLLIGPALAGDEVSSVVTADGVLAPVVSVRSAVSVRAGSGGEIIGAVLVGKAIDNAFVDSLKTATGLEVSVYGGNLLSATSLVATGNGERPIGVKEENKIIKERVLVSRSVYLGSAQFLNRPYFAVYTPLKDMNNTSVGMLVIGKPQVSVLQTAARSIEATFLLTVLVLMFSFLPIYLISRNLTRQLG